jgi:hypothetical protein
MFHVNNEGWMKLAFCRSNTYKSFVVSKNGGRTSRSHQLRHEQKLRAQDDEGKEVQGLHNKKERKKDNNTHTSFINNECKAFEGTIVILYKGGSSSL